MKTNSRFLLGLGVILLFSGVILPFMMVIKMLEPTFPLIFISSASSTLGLALGTVGLAQWTKKRP
ncbi:MAG: hypothetical protein L6Q49_03230 [Anaerolineales bacterium]|nr:MAG: hypothetical protein EDM79_02700 [Chloroflexota bacterium]MCE7858491.1 hypothetical protein [Chloroflexi bacterium CFX2]MCK6582092.1 hypothetical protein [Anaerolineales bacterium]GJQ34352.1 MAG: hypothetical protein JETCAE01_03620 [Anaerolineaceae bacterium]